MTPLRLGDYVEVAGLPGSQWQNRQGTIVEIVQSSCPEKKEIAQECAVNIAGKRCWFAARHLVKTVPSRLVRFFRAEVLERWHLEPNDVDGLSGDRHKLVSLLCDRLSFAMRRAETEADAFYTEFNESIARAVDESPSRQIPL